MEVRRICQWCGKPFIAQKTTTLYCSHHCANLGYKKRMRERRRQLKQAQELLQIHPAAEGQDYFTFSQAAQLMGVTRQYIYKLVKENKLRASRISGKKSMIRRADIELMLKTKPYERIRLKDDFDITEFYTAEQVADVTKSAPNGYGTIVVRTTYPKCASASSTITARNILMRPLPNMTWTMTLRNGTHPKKYRKNTA